MTDGENWVDGTEGVFLSLESESYHKSMAVSRSWLDHIEPPSLLVWYRSQPQERKAWQYIGQMVHSAFLEPNKPLPLIEKQPETIVGSDGKEYPWSGKDCSVTERKKWQKARDLAGIMVLKPDEWDTIHGCVESLTKNRTAAELFAKGQPEISCFKKFRVNDFVVMLRCRPDFTPDNVNFIPDVKTVRDGETRTSAFEKVVDSYKLQPAFYLDVFNAATGENRNEWMFCVVEKSPPFLSRVFRLRADSNAIRLGRAEYIRRLAVYAECVQSGVWPDWPSGAVDIDLPAYTVRKMEE